MLFNYFLFNYFSKFQSSVINWLSFATWDERKAFFISAFSVFDDGDNDNQNLSQLLSQIAKQKKRNNKVTRKKKAEGKSGLSCEPQNSQQREREPEAEASGGIPSILSEIVTNDFELTLWGKTFDKRKIVAMDLEFVTLVETRNGKGVNRMATVAIVDYWGQTVYKDKVKYNSNEFKLNDTTRALTGFNYKTFKDGNSFESIQTNVKNILADKLVIMHDHSGDFRALELNELDYEIFDLQSHWRQFNGLHGIQELGLGRVYYYYFRTNPQNEGHDAIIDAVMTIEIFTEIYVEFFYWRTWKYNRESLSSGYIPVLPLKYNLSKRLKLGLD